MRSFICKYAGHTYIAFSDNRARCSCCGATAGKLPTSEKSLKIYRKDRVRIALSKLALLSNKSPKIVAAESVLIAQLALRFKDHAKLDDTLDLLDIIIV